MRILFCIIVLLMSTNTYADNSDIGIYYADSTICFCDSIHSKYNEYDGTLELEIPFNDGSETGVIKQYHNSGKLRSEIPVINGIKQGRRVWYFENGNIAGSVLYKDGFIIGYKTCVDGRRGNETLDCL